MNLFENSKFIKGWMIFVIVMVIFIIIQILRAIFGGSWSTESIILVLVGANLGGTIGLVAAYAGIKSDYSHIKTDINDLKRNDRKFNNDLNDIKLELKLLAARIK